MSSEYHNCNSDGSCSTASPEPECELCGEPLGDQEVIQLDYGKRAHWNCAESAWMQQEAAKLR